MISFLFSTAHCNCYNAADRLPVNFLTASFLTLQNVQDFNFNTLTQGSSTFFSPRTPWLKETLSRDPHPRRPKFGPDIHIFYLELSVCHSHTHTHSPTYV